MTEKVDFKKLIEKHGAKKAAEIIRTTGKPLTEDFAKAHKIMDTFSNKTTAELVQQIEKENEIETASENDSESIQIPAQFSFVTTRSSVFTQDTLYAE